MILSLLNASQINNNYLVLREVYSNSDGFSSIFKKYRQFFNTKFFCIRFTKKIFFGIRFAKKIFFGIRFTKKGQNRMSYFYLTQEYLRKAITLKIYFKPLQNCFLRTQIII